MGRLEVPELWHSNIAASVALFDDLERQISEIRRRLKDGYADLPVVGRTGPRAFRLARLL